MTICQLHTPSLPALSAQLLGLELLQTARRLAHQLGLSRPRPLDPEALVPPDTAIATRAKVLVEELSSVALANHCHRSYLFALAIGRHRQWPFDRELLYVALMLHDLGLTEAHQGPGPFELRGADAALAFCLAQGLEPARADQVQEAIALHTRAMTAFAPPQVALVQLGAGADVIGYHLEDVASETLAQIVAEHPRLGMKREVEQLLRRAAQQSPDSELAVQMKLGFAKRIRTAPFGE